jgi:Tol biopolymer transport system component
LRSVNQLAARLIAGTEGNTTTPFFSPDGKWIAYASEKDDALMKIAVAGGAPVPLCHADLLGASWNTDNTIVFGTWGGDIMRISANGGSPERIVRGGPGALAFPRVLPDGKSLLYTANASSTQPKIMVRALKSGNAKELLLGVDARYLPTGHLIYSRGNNLLAAPFDLDKLEITGGSVPVVEGVFSAVTPAYSVSDSGTLVYIPGTARAPFIITLVWVDRGGGEEPLEAEPKDYIFPRISPDGTQLALTIGGPLSSDIWTWDLARKTLTRLTQETTNSVPLWSRDGKRIAYSSEGDRRVYWKAADGTGKVEPLTDATERSSAFSLYPWAWAGDGKMLVLEDYAGADIGMVSMEGDRKWKPLLGEKHAERQRRISPDGRWMAYISNESGRNEVYIRPFPDVDKGKWPVSTNGGDSPLWSPDGSELFYRNGDAVMAVAVRTNPSFRLETPKTLFKGDYFSNVSIVGPTWDVSPGGKRFLMMKERAVGEPRKINIVLNWLEELKQLVPVQ